MAVASAMSPPPSVGRLRERSKTIDRKEPRVEAAENQYGAVTRGVKRQETSNLLPFTVYHEGRSCVRSDLRSLVDPNSQTHPTFKTNFRYTRMTTRAVVEAAIGGAVVKVNHESQDDPFLVAFDAENLETDDRITPRRFPCPATDRRRPSGPSRSRRDPRSDCATI